MGYLSIAKSSVFRIMHEVIKMLKRLSEHMIKKNLYRGFFYARSG